MTASSKLTTPDGTNAELPMLQGTHGPAVADVRGLYKQAGIFTYDPGYATTASNLQTKAPIWRCVTC